MSKNLAETSYTILLPIILCSTQLPISRGYFSKAATVTSHHSIPIRLLHLHFETQVRVDQRPVVVLYKFPLPEVPASKNTHSHISVLKSRCRDFYTKYGALRRERVLKSRAWITSCILDPHLTNGVMRHEFSGVVLRICTTIAHDIPWRTVLQEALQVVDSGSCLQSISSTPRCESSHGLDKNVID